MTEKFKYGYAVSMSMKFDKEAEYDDNRIHYRITGELQGYNIEAHCASDTDGRTFIEDGDEEIGEVTAPQNHGAPFPIDVFFQNNVYPMEGEIEDIRDELGTEFSAYFDRKIDEVFDEIDGSDDPFDTIMEMDPDTLSDEESDE